MMKKVIIVVLLAAAIMGLPNARSDPDLLGELKTIEEQVAVKAACCDRCGACDRRIPELARCVCMDLVRRCHPSCGKCIEALHPPNPRYQCVDMAYYDCHRNCTHASTASE